MHILAQLTAVESNISEFEVVYNTLGIFSFKILLWSTSFMPPLTACTIIVFPLRHVNGIQGHA